MLGKGIPTSNHSLHPAKGGGDRAGRSMAVPPRAAYEASAHLCLPAQAPGRSSAVTGEPGQACCSVLSNRSGGGGEPAGSLLWIRSCSFYGAISQGCWPWQERCRRQHLRGGSSRLSFGSQTAAGLSCWGSPSQPSLSHCLKTSVELGLQSGPRQGALPWKEF